jgi:hypothetical protein
VIDPKYIAYRNATKVCEANKKKLGVLEKDYISM